MVHLFYKEHMCLAMAIIQTRLRLVNIISTKYHVSPPMRNKEGESVPLMKANQTLFLKRCIADALLNLMEHERYDAINVNAICEKAGIGRTTFYRHFTSKNSKEEILLFKITYEWEKYADAHKEEAQKDGNAVLLHFIYENKQFFRLLYQNGLVILIMKIFDESIATEWPKEKDSAYLRAFFTYGYFGFIYQWIQYDFDETPEEVLMHTAKTIAQAAKLSAEAENKS